MAIGAYSGSATSFGDQTNYLKSLKDALDAGQIDVTEYLQKGMPIAQKAYKSLNQYAGSGSSQATDAKRIMGIIEDSGFQLSPTANNQWNVLPQLDQKYQQQIRESLLPAGLTPEQKAAYLNEIPQDIQYGTDQYNIEKEGLRQKLQSEGVAATQKAQRASQLEDLAKLLSTNADTNFQRSIPTIAENANTAGIFRSTGYGEALAKQQAQLEQDVQSQLGQQALQNQAADTGALSDILAAQQGYQSSGLQRQFSLEDFASQARLAQQLADQSKPKNPGKTAGERFAQTANAGVQVGATAGAVGKSMAKKGA